MVFDEIVVGSGLVALGTVLGLAPARRVLVLGGARHGPALFYDAAASVPCARLAFGGLGEYWHGVIATGGREAIGAGAAQLTTLGRYFYPGTDFESRLGQPWLFVPRRPIRPRAAWERLRAGRDTLELRHETATRFELGNGRVTVTTGSATFEATRLWLAAGALHTPRLLAESLGVGIARATVSDHVICYLGLVAPGAGTDQPRVVRDAHGAWFECRYDRSTNGAATSLYTVRPARFGFRRLDFGLEQRAAFGLPMGGALAKILRRASPGLVSEALFNKFGWFADAGLYSGYAQVCVSDAYEWSAADSVLRPRTASIQAAIATARAAHPWAQLTASRQPERYLPGIHLHGSVDEQALRRLAGEEPAASLRVVDASIYRGIGPEHHSFKIMAAAAARARAS